MTAAFVPHTKPYSLPSGSKANASRGTATPGKVPTNSRGQQDSDGGIGPNYARLIW
jgi:hypothetical protein